MALCLNLFVLRETLPRLVAAKQQQQQQAGGSHSVHRSVGSTVQSAVTAGWQVFSSGIQHLFHRKETPYERIDSQVAQPSSSTVSSCGPGCTGCAHCWALWRAESGLVQPLQPEGSAISLELAAVKQQDSSNSEVLQHPPPHGQHTASIQLQRADSAIQHHYQQLQVDKKHKSVYGAGQHSPTVNQQAAHGSSGRQLQPNDSASEFTLRGLKPGSAKQQHFSNAEQQGADQAHQEGQPELMQQQALSNNAISRFDQGSDCTILVSINEHTDQTSQQAEGAEVCSDPLLGKQPGMDNSSGSSSSNSKALLPWYKQRQVVLVLLGYGTVCLLFCAIDELTPIFASAPLKQGRLCGDVLARGQQPLSQGRLLQCLAAA